MPVGSADKGVGLWAGQVMFSLDNANQHINWWHEALPESNEGFNHSGTLTSFMISPSITMGLSNYWNITITQVLGNRAMTWGGEKESIHHRNESSVSNFINAKGGVLGDTRFIFRYLFYNDGSGAGQRLFVGSGLIVPSKNTLTSDPFFLSEGDKTEHRHFAISQGAYKGVFELQYYKKRMVSPVFVGGSLTIEEPISENQYGYKDSRLYDASVTCLSKTIKGFPFSLGGNLALRHTTRAYWDGFPSPNSKATIFSPGVSLLWNLSVGSIAFGLQKPIFLSGGLAGTDSEDLDQKLNAWQLSISYRRILSFVIPWFDPLRGN